MVVFFSCCWQVLKSFGNSFGWNTQDGSFTGLSAVSSTEMFHQNVLGSLHFGHSLRLGFPQHGSRVQRGNVLKLCKRPWQISPAQLWKLHCITSVTFYWPKQVTDSKNKRRLSLLVGVVATFVATSYL